MLLTAGLFNLFKCFFTSNFCFDTPDLAAQDSENNPHRHKHTKKPLASFSVLRCTAPIVAKETLKSKNLCFRQIIQHWASKSSPKKKKKETLRRRELKQLNDNVVSDKFGGGSGFVLAKIQPHRSKSKLS